MKNVLNHVMNQEEQIHDNHYHDNTGSSLNIGILIRAGTILNNAGELLNPVIKHYLSPP